MTESERAFWQRVDEEIMHKSPYREMALVLEAYRLREKVSKLMLAEAKGTDVDRLAKLLNLYKMAYVRLERRLRRMSEAFAQ